MPNLEIEYIRLCNIENVNSIVRKILVVDGMPFYRSSGINSGQELAGTFLPFLGIETQGVNSGWFRKPGFIEELSPLSGPLIELLNNYYNRQDDSKLKQLPHDSIKRFASIKCMLISSLLDEAKLVDEIPPSSFISKSTMISIEKSYWRSKEGIRLKACLKQLYADFYQKNQYCLHDKGLVIDIRSTVKYSFEQRTRLTQLNCFLEKQIQKQLSLAFSAKAFSDNLTRHSLSITPAEDWIHYLPVSKSGVITKKVKQAKKQMARWIDRSQAEGLHQPNIETYQPREPVKYNHFIWPQSVDELGITEEERAETDLHLFYFYHSIHQNLLENKIKFLQAGDSFFYQRNANSFITLKGDDKKIITYLNIKILFNGQIVVLPKTAEIIFSNKQKFMEIYKVFNVTQGEWMVLKTSSPNHFRAELLSLSGKPGISEISDYCVSPWTITTTNAEGVITKQQVIQKVSIVEKLYPQTFTQRLVEGGSLSTEQKTRYILQLLKGLANIHALSCQHDDISPIHIPAFHGDIKLPNIMYDAAKDAPCIIDFDNFGKWDIITLSNYCISPEVAAFIVAMPASCMQKNDIIQFNAKNGQAMDLWNIALIFSIILQRPSISAYYPSGIVFPPFYFIHNRLNRPDQKERYYHDIMQLKQAEIDAEIELIIEHLPDTTEGRQLFCLWSIVIAMLKVDPAKRESAATLAHILETRMSHQFVEDEAIDDIPKIVACSSFC